MLTLILHMLILGAVILGIERILPRMHVEDYGAAVIVAVVYSIINALLFWILAFFTLPLMFLTLGLFSLVINTGLLWLTDELLESIEIEDIGTTFVAATLITLANLAIEAVL